MYSRSIRVAEQRGERGRELLGAVGIDQPPVGTVADDFFDALAAASDGDFAGGHRFKVDAAKAFIAAGQCEERAAPEETGNLGAGDATKEVDAIVNF